MRNSKKGNNSSQDFEVALEEYISDVVAVEKERYRSDLRPFSAYEREIRTKLKEVFQFFHTAFSNGYHTLIEELKLEMATSSTKEDLLALVKIDPAKFKIFTNSKALVKAIEEGIPLYELLGYTEKSLNAFCQTVRRMIEEKSFKRARDVSYFLVTIAPWVSQFWVCLGKCDVGLEAYDVAFQEFAYAIELDPTDASIYQEMINLLIETHDFNKASSLCDAALQFTTEHRDEPWAEPLRARLEKKSKDIQAAVRNLKYRAS